MNVEDRRDAFLARCDFTYIISGEVTMITELKINVVSLASESRYIRRQLGKLKEEGKGGTDEYKRMHNHRVWEVRNESRAAQLVYAFARTKHRYECLEKLRQDDWWRWEDVMKRARRKCKKFGLDHDNFLRWTEGGDVPPMYTPRVWLDSK